LISFEEEDPDADLEPVRLANPIFKSSDMPPPPGAPAPLAEDSGEEEDESSEDEGPDEASKVAELFRSEALKRKQPEEAVEVPRQPVNISSIVEELVNPDLEEEGDGEDLEGGEEEEEVDNDWFKGPGLQFSVDSAKAYRLDEERAQKTLETYDPLDPKSVEKAQQNTKKYVKGGGEEKKWERGDRSETMRIKDRVWNGAKPGGPRELAKRLE
jgi:hypothetical protein